MLEITIHFMNKGKLVAAICHGPQILVSADVVKGRRATSYNSVRKELASSGAKVMDEEVVKDGNLLTSREFQDLHVFGRELMKLVKNH